METNRNINNRILNKFLILLDKGYDIDICIEKFPAYREESKVYANIIENFSNFKKLKPKEEYLTNNLKNIYSLARIEAGEKRKDFLKREIRLTSLRPAYLKPLIAFLSVFIFISFSFAGTVYASSNTIPGETLYDVKRTYENIQLVFTPYNYEGKLYYTFLNKRLNEADILLQTNSELNLKIAEELIDDIDYSYNKCLEHKYLGVADEGHIKKQINGIKDGFKKRFRKQGADDTIQNNADSLNNELNQNKENIQDQTNQNIQNSQDIQDTQNIQDGKNNQNSQDIQNQQNMESTQNKEDSQDIENSTINNDNSGDSSQQTGQQNQYGKSQGK